MHNNFINIQNYLGMACWAFTSLAAGPWEFIWEQYIGQESHSRRAFGETPCWALSGSFTLPTGVRVYNLYLNSHCTGCKRGQAYYMRSTVKFNPPKHNFNPLIIYYSLQVNILNTVVFDTDHDYESCRNPYLHLAYFQWMVPSTLLFSETQ